MFTIKKYDSLKVTTFAKLSELDVIKSQALNSKSDSSSACDLLYISISDRAAVSCKSPLRVIALNVYVKQTGASCHTC